VNAKPRLADSSDRELAMRRGTSGELVRRSIAAKTANSTSDSANSPTVWAEPQPAVGASTSA
jgi:hypothetical protein